MSSHVKFLAFTDIHVDIMPDTVARMQVILETAKRQKVDFILQLGDFMYPEADFLQQHAPESLELRKERAWFVCDRDDEKRTIRSMIEASGITIYNILGNHDMDSCSKRTACAYFDLPNPFYHFDRGDIRFIVLDTNISKIGEQFVDYDHCNYRYHTQEQATWLSPEQLSYIEQTVSASPYPCVLLSHASLGDHKLSIHNKDDLHELLYKLNCKERKVVLAINGHSHIDGVCVRKGIPMMNINSASNIWIGHKYDAVRYSETISRLYPHIKGCAPYIDALFAIFEINDQEIRVTGRESTFVGPAPYELGVPREAACHPITPSILSRHIPMIQMADCDHLQAEV